MASKRSSYPSRQLRSGPAPLASFEDLSDEISSPDDPDAAVERHDDDDDDGDGDEKTAVEEDDVDSTLMYSDGATPSTPRVLAQTPSTPLALDNSFSMGTPDSLDGGDRNVECSRPDTGRADSPQFHFTDVVIDEPPVPTKKSGGITPSPRSSRKLFTMSFFKPRAEDRSPSPPVKSPKSPRRLSPSAISPKSPRRLLPFGTFFRSGKDHLEVTSLGCDQSTSVPGTAGLPPPSPTKKKGHFPNFLWSKEESKKSHSGEVCPSTLAAPVKKDGATRYANVFANLFRKGDVQAASAASPASSATDGQVIGRTTPDDRGEEWSSTKVDATQPPSSTANTDVFDAEREGIGIDDRNMFDSTHDIAEDLEFDPNLRLGISPSADIHSPAVAAPILDRQKPLTAVQPEEMLPLPPSDAIVTAVDDTDRASPTESEVEAPDDSDPIMLKTDAKGDEPEAETLLREDSFEVEDFGGEEVLAAAIGQVAAIEKAEQMALTKHKDKMASFRTNPLERPRSTAPVSFSSLEAYISIVGTRRKTSPTLEVRTDSEFESDPEKLKVILPGEEFEHKERQTKKPGVYKSWFEFCEVGLQSPRTRRRQMAGGSERASSAPSATRASSVSVGERCKLVDVGFSASSDAWVTFDSSTIVGGGDPDETDATKPMKFISKSLPRPPKFSSTTMTMSSSSSSSSSDSCPSQPNLRKRDSQHSSGRNSRSSSGRSSPTKSPVVIDPVSPIQPTDTTTSPPEYFMPSNGDFSKDWTLRTTFSSDDIHFSSVPDCVASVSVHQERVDHNDLSQSLVSDFFNGGIDLLASIPAMSKCQPASSTVTSSSFRRPPPPPPPPRAPTAETSSALTSHQGI